VNFARKIFSGDIRDPWIDKQVEHIFPKKRVIKEVRANLLLEWLDRKFEPVPKVLIIRHPCAVVLSRMKLGWWTDQDIAPFLSQPKLIEDHLADKIGLIQSAKTDVEKHAIIWCICNRVPLHSNSYHNMMVIFYEDLCLQPEIEIPRLFQFIQVEHKPTIFQTLFNPSTTTRRSSAIMTGRDRVTGWRSELSSEQIKTILRMVEGFELCHLYGESDTPIIKDQSIWCGNE
jgi:hypothetical protein